MKNTLTVVLVAALSGFLGAYTYQKLFPVALSNTKESRLQAPTFVHYSGANLDEGVSFVNASAISTPSVVYIKTAMAQQASYNWYDFFFNGVPQTQMVISSGSGVIYSKDGYVITNNHVIERADQIEVILNKRTYKAKLIGTDPSTDLAILKIEGENFVAVTLGRSKTLAVGDWVLAVGNPFNLESTVTAGIVSAKGRNINILKDRFPIESFIQTDAAINPGNSGGALVNIKGELVGINTAILSQTGSYAGYGFAVPIDIVRKVADDIIKYGEVQKSFFGADIAEVDDIIAKKFELKDLSGVVVTSVLSEGAAEKVGIRKGDVVFEINGDPISTRSSFDEELSYYRPGDKIKVKFIRDDKVIETALTLTNREGTTELIKREVYISDQLGAELESVSKIERDRIGLQSGVRIVRITSRGLISEMGIHEGFIITSVNNFKVLKPKDLTDILNKVKGRVIVEGMTANGQKGYYQFIF